MILLLALLALPTQEAAPVAAWTRFRGPNGSGVLDEGPLPARLDPASSLGWRTPLPPGHSSPVVHEGRIYLTALDGEILQTLCVDALSGRVAWRRSAPRPRTDTLDGRNHPASPTPVVGPEGVFVFFPEFGVLGYDHFGEELWRVPLGPFENVYGMGASPILHEGTVILACDQSLDSFLVALDAATGEVRWRAERPTARSGHCTPIILAVDSNLGSRGVELLLPGSFYLDAYDPVTGAELWSAGGLSFEMKSVPVVWGDHVFTNGYGSPMNQPGNQITVQEFDEVLAERDADGDGVIAENEMPPSRAAAWFSFVDLDKSGGLDARDWTYLQQALASQNGMLAFDVQNRMAGAPAMSWSYRRSVPQLPSPLAYRDVLYMLNDAGGVLVAFRPATGEELWKGRLEGAVDTFYASPIAGDGKLYFLSEHGLVVVAAPMANGELKPIYTGDLGENVYATPAISGGSVFVRTTEALYAFRDQPAEGRAADGRR